MAFNTRIQHKIDTAAGWEGSSITLLDGELALVKIDGKVRMKVGDGSSTYTSLPFFDQDANAHIANKNNPHGVTKEQLNLDKVNNTADSEKTVKAANALTVVSKGSATKPVYFDANGVPVACTYSLGKSVPSDAVFTDTVYTHPNSGVTAGTYRSVTVNAQGHVTAGSNPVITIAQGGTNATSADGARTNLELNITSYTTYAELGLSDTPADMPTLLAAIPACSQFIKAFSSSYEQFGLPFEGTLIIFKSSYNECMLWLTSAYSKNWRMAFGFAPSSGVVTWKDPSFLENGALPARSWQ